MGCLDQQLEHPLEDVGRRSWSATPQVSLAALPSRCPDLVLEALVADGVVVQLGEQGAGSLKMAAVDPEHALGGAGVAEQPQVPEPLEGGLGLVEGFFLASSQRAVPIRYTLVVKRT